MNKAMLAGMVLATGAACSLSAAVVIGNAEMDEAVPAVLEAHVPDQVLVRVRDGVSDEQFAEALKQVQGSVLEKYTIVPGLMLVRVGVPVREAMFILGGRGDLVKYVEPDYICEPTAVPNDPRYTQMYGLQSVRAPQAWDTWTGDPNFVIAVCDTGMDIAHPDLVDNLWHNPGEIAGNGIDDDGNGKIDDVFGWNFMGNNASLLPQDSASHGVHVSGTIAARGNNAVGVTGVCWQAQIMTIRWLNNSGEMSDFITGFQYALQQGARLSNHSWGGPGEQALTDVIEAARVQGHLMIVAAGNDSTSALRMPAGSTSENVITVAAVDSNDVLATFSNWSVTGVDIAAPGVNILSTIQGNGYGSLDGTSMACPHMCGVAGLLWSKNQDWSYLDVRDVLLASVRAVPGLASRCVTGGVIDASVAVNSSRPLRVELVTPLPTEVQTGAMFEVRVRATSAVDLSGLLFVRYRGEGESAYASLAMSAEGNNVYSAMIPSGSCPGSASLYFAAVLPEETLTYPGQGELAPLSTVVLPDAPLFTDGFDTDLGWTVGSTGDTATIGHWARATPQATIAQPAGDRHAITGSCMVTGPLSGASSSSYDVDGGTTSVVSPVFDLTGMDTVTVGFWLWFSTNTGAYRTDLGDRFAVQVTNDGGATWVAALTVPASAATSAGGWKFRSFSIDPAVARTAQMRLRFQVTDSTASPNGPTVVEAAIDDVFVSGCASTPACTADFNGSGGVEVQDIFDFLTAWFELAPHADVNGVDGVNVQDIFDFIQAWFTGC